MHTAILRYVGIYIYILSSVHRCTCASVHREQDRGRKVLCLYISNLPSLSFPGVPPSRAPPSVFLYFGTIMPLSLFPASPTRHFPIFEPNSISSTLRSRLLSLSLYTEQRKLLASRRARSLPVYTRYTMPPSLCARSLPLVHPTYRLSLSLSVSLGIARGPLYLERIEQRTDGRTNEPAGLCLSDGEPETGHGTGRRRRLAERGERRVPPPKRCASQTFIISFSPDGGIIFRNTRQSRSSLYILPYATRSFQSPAHTPGPSLTHDRILGTSVCPCLNSVLARGFIESSRVREPDICVDTSISVFMYGSRFLLHQLDPTSASRSTGHSRMSILSLFSFFFFLRLEVSEASR